MKAPESNDDFVSVWKKCSGQEIRIGFHKYRGHELVSLRVWKKDRKGEYQASKHGINLALKHLPKAVAGLKEARRIIKSGKRVF
jgi:Transcriptional Coactivator p15 (PC4)